MGVGMWIILILSFIIFLATFVRIEEFKIMDKKERKEKGLLNINGKKIL
jgi:hypothetical protein